MITPYYFIHRFQSQNNKLPHHKSTEEWKVSTSLQIYLTLACENSRFSSLLATGDVSPGGTSATQRQKFQTDDEKFVRNPVTSADWMTE